jgi:hypothetical protein
MDSFWLQAGDNCGASYLNKNYEKRLLDRLADEKYLENNANTLKSIVQATVQKFEDHDKRIVDVTKRQSGRVPISGLKGDRQRGLVGGAAKGFEDNILILQP